MAHYAVSALLNACEEQRIRAFDGFITTPAYRVVYKHMLSRAMPLALTNPHVFRVSLEEVERCARCAARGVRRARSGPHAGW